MTKVTLTQEAYDLLTEGARKYNGDQKAIASEAIIKFFMDRPRLLQINVSIAIAFAVGVVIGVSIL